MKGPAVPTVFDRFGPPREPHNAGRTSLREFLYPQIGRPLCRVFALAADTWPERMIAADLIHEKLGAGRAHLVAEASDPNLDASGARHRLMRPQR